jgi:IS30 family transposase
LAERTVIADLRREHRTIRDIAAVIGRSPATVSRELRRNVDHKGRYLPLTAHRIAAERLPRPRARRLLVDAELRAAVMELLEQRWSPEQIARELRLRFHDQREARLSVETLYQAIYDPDVPVTRPAKRRRRRRRRRVQGLERRGRLTAMTMIADRPLEVAEP